MATTIAIQARDEAFASALPDKAERAVIELDNAAFDAPLFFIGGVEDDTVITLEDGTVVTAIATGFSCTLPGFDESGPTPAKLSVDNISTKIYPYLRQSAGVILVTYRCYLGEDYSTVADLIEGLQMKMVDLTATSAEGELTFAEITTQAFPRLTYDLDTYPALWNS
jgi:hypothetical protein